MGSGFSALALGHAWFRVKGFLLWGLGFRVFLLWGLGFRVFPMGFKV